jgi:hypothetical protein
MTANAQVEYTLYVRRYAPFRSFGGGFEGDSRPFSTSPDATARTVGVVTFGIGAGAVMASRGFSSGSSWVGPWEVRKSYPLGSITQHGGKVRATMLDVLANRISLSFTLYTEGNLPLKDILFHKSIADGIDRLNQAVRPNSRHPQGTPDIDTFLDFKAMVSGKRILFEGTVRGDGFPNAEVFLVDGRSQALALFDYRTKSNEAGPLHRLFGANAGNRLGTFRREVEILADGSFGPGHGGPPTVVQE